MPRTKRKKVVVVLVEIDRVRWQGAADRALISLDRFVREAVENEIKRRETPAFLAAVSLGWL